MVKSLTGGSFPLAVMGALCIGQIEASTSPPGIPWAFDLFSCPGGREFD